MALALRAIESQDNFQGSQSRHLFQGIQFGAGVPMVSDLGDDVHVRRSETVQEIRQPRYDAAFEDVVRVIEVDGFEID